ncbi:MAG TPA: hypothetical protein VMY34_06310 [Acidimicrobiales bacterium]|nr:hypothetical protein [Acidimicrobiales bacterium]
MALVSFVVAVVLVGLGLIVLAATTADDRVDARRSPVQDGSAIATLPPTSTAGTVAVVPAAPGSILAVTATGLLVTLDPASGAVASTLDDRFPDGANPRGRTAPQIASIDRATDGSAWYSVDHFGDGGRCTGVMWHVPASGGAPQEVGDGDLPALSPRGDTLAYIDSCHDHALVVRDLDTGKERAIAAGGGWRAYEDIYRVSWSEDGGEVILSAAKADAPSEVFVVDIAATTLARRRRLGPLAATPEGTGWRDATPRSIDDTVLVIEACCIGARDAIDNGGRLIAVDLATGGQRGSADFGFEIGRVAADASGAHLLIGDGSGNLYRRSDGAPRRLERAPRGLRAFDW